MEFDIEKCAMLTIKRARAEGRKLPNQQSIRTLGEKNYKLLGILAVDIIKEAEMKGKKTKIVPQKNEKTS